MPLSDRPVEGGHRKPVVISGEEPGRDAVTTTPAAGGKVALDVNITAGAGAGGTSMTDDSAFTPGASGITPAGGYYNFAGEAVDDGDAGALAMTERRALHTTIRTPNDDSAMDDANDAVRVNIVAGGGAGGTSQTDDTAFTPGASSLTPIGAFADETAPDSVDEGDIGAPRMSLNRILYSSIRDGAGNERGANVNATNELEVSVENGAGAAAVNVQDGGNSLTVDDGGAPISVDDNGGALSVDDNGGSLTVDQATHDSFNANANIQVGDADVANGNPVPVSDAGGTLTVDGTVTVQDGGGSISVDDGGGVLSVDDNGGSLTVDAAGDVADDAADSGNPVKIGGVAVETDGSDPTSVAEGDRAQVRTDRNRRLLVNDAHPNLWDTNNNYAVAQTNQQQKAAPGANLSLYIETVIMSTDTAMNIRIVDDTAGAPATILGPYYFAANGGIAIQLKPPKRVDANTDIGITSSAAGNHTVTLSGYTAP